MYQTKKDLKGRPVILQVQFLEDFHHAKKTENKTGSNRGSIRSPHGSVGVSPPNRPPLVHASPSLYPARSSPYNSTSCTHSFIMAVCWEICSWQRSPESTDWGEAIARRTFIQRYRFTTPTPPSADSRRILRSCRVRTSEVTTSDPLPVTSSKYRRGLWQGDVSLPRNRRNSTNCPIGLCGKRNDEKAPLLSMWFLYRNTFISHPK